MHAGSRWPEGRILVADDCPVQRVMLTVHLEAAGFLVVAVATGEEALEIARRGSFDLIILDVNIPDMDGPQIGRALRADPAARDTRILMHSTEDEPAITLRFSAFDGYVAKSATATQLRERVCELMLDERRRDVRPGLGSRRDPPPLRPTESGSSGPSAT